MKFLICDVESTGVDAYSDFVTQIGAIKRIEKDGEVREDGFRAHVKPPDYPNIPYGEQVEEKTGIPFKEIENFYEEEYVLRNFINWVTEGKKFSFYDRYVFIAYNANFDFNMVRRMFQRHGMLGKFNKIFIASPMDIFSLAYCLRQKLNLTSKVQLATIAKEFGIQSQSEDLHDAFNDVKLLRSLFLKLREEGHLL